MNYRGIGCLAWIRTKSARFRAVHVAVTPKGIGRKGGNRTPDALVFSQPLYRLSYRSLVFRLGIEPS